MKITFVFFVAAMLSKSTEFADVVRTTILAAAHVLVLVASSDLGGALLFFVTYLVMLYVATKKPLYFWLAWGPVRWQRSSAIICLPMCGSGCWPGQTLSAS